MATPSRRIVVLGVGNFVMGDEGLGVHCVQQMESQGTLPPDVTILDGGTSTNELLGDLENLDLLVIVDAVAGDGAPGTVIRLEGDEVPFAFSNTMSPHQHGLHDLLATLRLLGREPKRVVVIGAKPARIALGLELSPELAAVLPELQRQVRAEITAAQA